MFNSPYSVLPAYSFAPFLHLSIELPRIHHLPRPRRSRDDSNDIQEVVTSLVTVSHYYQHFFAKSFLYWCSVFLAGRPCPTTPQSQPVLLRACTPLHTFINSPLFHPSALILLRHAPSSPLPLHHRSYSLTSSSPAASFALSGILSSCVDSASLSVRPFSK